MLNEDFYKNIKKNIVTEVFPYVLICRDFPSFDSQTLSNADRYRKTIKRLFRNFDTPL